MLKLRLHNNRFILVGVDISSYALLIGGRSSYPPSCWLSYGTQSITSINSFTTINSINPISTSNTMKNACYTVTLAIRPIITLYQVYYSEISRGSIYTSSTSNYPVHAGLLRFPTTLELQVQHSSLQIYTNYYLLLSYPIYSGRQTTLIIVDAPAGVTLEEGPAVLTCLNFYRAKSSVVPFPRRA